MPLIILVVQLATLRMRFTGKDCLSLSLSPSFFPLSLSYWQNFILFTFRPLLGLHRALTWCKINSYLNAPHAWTRQIHFLCTLWSLLPPPICLIKVFVDDAVAVGGSSGSGSGWAVTLSVQLIIGSPYSSVVTGLRTGATCFFCLASTFMYPSPYSAKSAFGKSFLQWLHTTDPAWTLSIYSFST